MSPLLCGPPLCGPLLCGPLLCGPLLCGPLLCGPLLCGPLLCGPAADERSGAYNAGLALTFVCFGVMAACGMAIGGVASSSWAPQTYLNSAVSAGPFRYCVAVGNLTDSLQSGCGKGRLRCEVRSYRQRHLRAAMAVGPVVGPSATGTSAWPGLLLMCRPSVLTLSNTVALPYPYPL